MEEKKKIIHSYRFTQAELKKQLGIKGDITDVGLFNGLSPKDREDNKSPDTQVFYIHTEEGRID